MRDGPVVRRDRELWATARMVDSAAAEMQMLAEEDCLRGEEEAERLANASEDLRDIARRIWSHTSDRRYRR